MRIMKLFTVSSIGIALAIVGRSQAATLVADYQLQSTFASSVGSIGALAVVGTPGDVTFNTDQNVDGNVQTVAHLDIDGSGTLTGDTGAGLQAQTNGFLSADNYSVVLLADFDISTDLIATKIFDFKNLSSDDGLYVNETSGLLDFNGEATAIGGTPAVSGTYTQIVLTRDSSDDLVTVYEDGTEAFHFTDSSGLAILGDSTSPSANAFLTVFKDDAVGLGIPVITDETSVGDIARLRLYDGALTPEEVASLDTTVPEPVTGMLMLAGVTMILGRRRETRQF
jgi:hypothetical protein